MMQSSGTAEGLRGLIDTSILESIKKIIKYRGLFGPTVVPLGTLGSFLLDKCLIGLYVAINIMATFIHSEPTSLAIIQEAGLPETFYAAIEVGLEPAIEVRASVQSFSPTLHITRAGDPSNSQRHRGVVFKRRWNCATCVPSQRHSSHFLYLYLRPSPQGPSR
jgi:E3 ubiquitin-protein ligase HUWE1